MAELDGGALVAIPTASGTGLAKIVYASSYFSDVILVKLFRKKLPPKADLSASDFAGDFDLYYTAATPLRSRRWLKVGSESVSPEELALNKRTSGGEVWVEDRHLGTARDNDLATLPKMLVHGFKLIEKYVDRTR